MRAYFIFLMLAFATCIGLLSLSCANAHPSNAPAHDTSQRIPSVVTDTTHYDTCNARIIHVFVALCDNDSQGIVPVPKKIGNGNDPNNNLYWGCGYGVRTFFNNSPDWQLLRTDKKVSDIILERCIWKHRRNNVVLIADAYRGARIKTCTVRFLENAAGACEDTTSAMLQGKRQLIVLNQAALVAYVGHDGLMDFSIAHPPQHRGEQVRDVMIFACASRSYFREVVQAANANPILWTTNLMSPEAYSLKAAVDGWILHESGQEIRQRAAQAYNEYQHCGLKGAQNLFATGF